MENVKSHALSIWERWVFYTLNETDHQKSEIYYSCLDSMVQYKLIQDFDLRLGIRIDGEWIL